MASETLRCALSHLKPADKKKPLKNGKRYLHLDGLELRASPNLLDSGADGDELGGPGLAGGLLDGPPDDSVGAVSDLLEDVVLVVEVGGERGRVDRHRTPRAVLERLETVLDVSELEARNHSPTIVENIELRTSSTPKFTVHTNDWKLGSFLVCDQMRIHPSVHATESFYFDSVFSQIWMGMES